MARIKKTARPPGRVVPMVPKTKAPPSMPRSNYLQSSVFVSETTENALKAKIHTLATKHMLSLFNSEKTSDMVLRYNNLTLFCHKFIFHLHSVGLANLLENLGTTEHDKPVLQLEQSDLISEEHVHIMIRFFYGGDFDLNDENVMDVVRVALEFQCTILAAKCASFLLKRVMSAESCSPSVLEIALALENEDLIGACYSRLMNIPIDFHDLPLKKALMLFGSDFLVMKERDVLNRVQRFVESNVSTLSQNDISELYQCVRYPQLEKEEFKELMSPLVQHGIIHSDELLEVIEYKLDASLFENRLEKRFRTRVNPFVWRTTSHDVEIHEEGKSVHWNGTSGGQGLATLGPLREGTEIIITTSEHLYASFALDTGMSNSLRVSPIFVAPRDEVDAMISGDKKSRAEHWMIFSNESLFTLLGKDTNDVSPIQLVQSKNVIRIERDGMLTVKYRGNVYVSNRSLREMYPNATVPEYYFVLGLTITKAEYLQEVALF